MGKHAGEFLVLRKLFPHEEFNVQTVIRISNTVANGCHAGMNFGFFFIMKWNKSIKIEIDFEGKHYIGKAKPVRNTFVAGMPQVLDIFLQNRHLGFIHYETDEWKMHEQINPTLVQVLGNTINKWYERVADRKLMRELSKTLN